MSWHCLALEILRHSCRFYQLLCHSCTVQSFANFQAIEHGQWLSGDSLWEALPEFVKRALALFGMSNPNYGLTYVEKLHGVCLWDCMVGVQCVACLHAECCHDSSENCYAFPWNPTQTYAVYVRSQFRLWHACTSFKILESRKWTSQSNACVSCRHTMQLRRAYSRIQR